MTARCQAFRPLRPHCRCCVTNWKEYLAEFDIPMTAFMAESSARSATGGVCAPGYTGGAKRRAIFRRRDLSFVHRKQDLVPQKDGRNILERFVSAPGEYRVVPERGEIRFVNTNSHVEKRHVNFFRTCRFR